MLLGVKTELKLNNHQRTALAKHCGVARLVRWEGSVGVGSVDYPDVTFTKSKMQSNYQKIAAAIDSFFQDTHEVLMLRQKVLTCTSTSYFGVNNNYEVVYISGKWNPDDFVFVEQLFFADTRGGTLADSIKELEKRVKKEVMRACFTEFFVSQGFEKTDDLLIASVLDVLPWTVFIHFYPKQLIYTIDSVSLQGVYSEGCTKEGLLTLELL